jgi:hypothetical protein
MPSPSLSRQPRTKISMNAPFCQPGASVLGLGVRGNRAGVDGRVCAPADAAPTPPQAELQQ